MGRQAPGFSLQDQFGVARSLKDYAGSWLVLYFYPRDNSVGCTAEACSFRDEQNIIAQFGNASVVGINHGSVASHKKFSDKNRINFPLLSDPSHEVTQAYGAWRKGKVRLLDKPFPTRRNTYIINPEGAIVKEYHGVNPNDHVETIISDLQALQK